MGQKITPYMLQRQQHIFASRPLRNKVQQPIPQKSEKRKAKEKEMGNDDSLQKWFEERRLELTGTCLHCGGKTYDINAVMPDGEDETVYKNKMQVYKHCIAHILPKRYFPSVATHPLNWIELCFWGNSCHTNFDSHKLDIMELNCFDLVIERFQEIYPMIDKAERKHIPEVLRQYINVDL